MSKKEILVVLSHGGLELLSQSQCSQLTLTDKWYMFLLPTCIIYLESFLKERFIGGAASVGGTRKNW